MANEKYISEQEIINTRHVLSLLRNQLRTGQVDAEYLSKQFDKLETLIERLYEIQNERRSADRFEALYDVSRILGTSLDQDVVLEQVMDAVIRLTGAERGFLMLRDDDGELHIKVGRNYDQRSLTNEQIQYSRTIANHVLDTGESLLTTNAVEDPRFAGNVSVVAQSLRSILATPLRIRDDNIGIIYVENRVVAGLFTPDDQTTLEALAAQAAIAIDNARLFEVTDAALSKRLEEIRQLRRIDLQLNDKLDFDRAVLLTLDWACRISGASAGHFAFLEGQPRRLIARHIHTTDDVGVIKPLLLDEIYPSASQVVETEKPLIFDTGQYGLHTALLMPVMRERQVVGVLALERQDGHNFTAEHQEMVERLVARAIVSIDNARLYAAVQQADKAKSEFVGIVAHDLKAPMTSIRGYADLILMNPEHLTDRHSQFLERISNTVQRMEVLVSDLADISRIESGQFILSEGRVTVQSVVDAVRDTTTPEIQARQHEFIEDVEPDLPDLLVDYYRLIQVLTNLVSNAYKYTPNGGRITLRVARRGGRIHFGVEDTGIGLSKEAIQKLGTKFWRAEDDYTRSQPGTGLGFAITANLIAQMGSRIEIMSEPGHGSQFGFDVAVAPAGEVVSPGV